MQKRNAPRLRAEDGADGRYAVTDATDDDIRTAGLNQDVPIKTNRIKNGVNYHDPDFEIFLSDYLNQKIQRY